MPFVISSPLLSETGGVSDGIALDLILSADISPEAFNPFTDDDIQLDLELSADIETVSSFTGGIDGELILQADIVSDSSLNLTDPPPILESISENAFSAQKYKALLFINNVETDFLSAEINAPRGYSGVILKINLARAVLSQIPNDASFKFQIGQGGVFETILDNGELDGRQYSVSGTRDQLSFSTLSLLNDRLSKCPKKNLIVYDGTKITVSSDEIESVPIAGGGSIITQSRNIPVLTLYKLLNIAFVEGCGFSSVNTDLPNFEITRADFTVSNSYYDVVKPFIGIFETEIFERDGEIWIVDTTKPLPSDFEPVLLPASSITGFSENLSSDINKIDGIELIYSGIGATYQQDRQLTDVAETTGTYGSADYTETTIKRRIREWFEFDNPGEVVRSEIKEEIREVRQGINLTGVETSLFNFDRAGRSKGYTKTIEARMPDVLNSNLPSLLTTREETQSILYKQNPFASRQTIQSRIESSVKSLLAVDTENTALDKNGDDAPYKQDYEKVFESGGLRPGMTAEFAALETQTETFIPKRNGQIEVRVERFDILRGKPKPPISETRSGDISVSNNPEQRSLVILKNGLTNSTRTGKPIPSFAAGELPLRFARPLVERKPANGSPPTGSVNIPGYSESVQQGVLLGVPTRTGDVFGNFLVTAYRVDIQPNSIETSVEAIRMETAA